MRDQRILEIVDGNMIPTIKDLPLITRALSEDVWDYDESETNKIIDTYKNLTSELERKIDGLRHSKNAVPGMRV